jgi:hypothetical protein
MLASGISTPPVGHTYRHSFATSLLDRGQDIKTTMIFTHVLNRGPLSVRSPADFLKRTNCYGGSSYQTWIGSDFRDTTSSMHIHFALC